MPQTREDWDKKGIIFILITALNKIQFIFKFGTVKGHSHEDNI